MSVTIATPSRYTDGTECYVAQNVSYPGIIGQGRSADEALASFEAARRAYEVMMARPHEALATLTWSKPVSVISGWRPPLAIPA